MAEELPASPGVYIIRHEPTGAVYVGQSNNVRRRWAEHRRDLRLNKHPNVGLQEAWRRSNGNGFVVYLHSECPSGMSALETQRWLVRAERAALEEFRKRDIVTNQADPEIVATTKAREKHKQEREQKDRTHDQELTRRRKEIRTTIQKLQEGVSQDQLRRRALFQEIAVRKQTLKDSTGWRRLLFGPPTNTRPDTQRNELAGLVAEASALEQRLHPIEQEVNALQAEHDQLYRQFSKVRRRALNRFLIRAGGMGLGWENKIPEE